MTTLPRGVILIRLAPLILTAVAAIVPLLALNLGGLLPGILNSPGTLQLLAVCLIFGALALTYDVMLGYTGLVSFGHALYFALGSYGTNIAMSRLGLPLVPAVLLTVGATAVVALVVGTVSLRVTGIIFAMVTLAFGEAFLVFVRQNPGGLTGGEDGIGLSYTLLPEWMVGVVNTRNLYWLSLGLLVVVWVITKAAVRSDAGRVWQAIRDNPDRATVLGYEIRSYKLVSFSLACVLASVCGAMFLMLQAGSSPEIATDHFSLTVLTMVILGGAGYRWGAVLGGIVYHYLDIMLVNVTHSEALEWMPEFVSAPLQEPMFVFGVLLMLVVILLPGGLAEGLHILRDRLSGRRPTPSEQVRENLIDTEIDAGVDVK